VSNIIVVTMFGLILCGPHVGLEPVLLQAFCRFLYYNTGFLASATEGFTEQPTM
jgi:hypothetical protein